MENSTEDRSSPANHSYSGAGAGNASEESGWTSYIDYFMETQRRQEDASGCAAPSTEDDVGSCSSTSHYGGDCAVGGSSWLLPALIEPSEESRKLSLKRESRRKKAMYDDSLEDTATSPIRSPKVRARL
jgi:hypothetical protein